MNLGHFFRITVSFLIFCAVSTAATPSSALPLARFGVASLSLREGQSIDLGPARTHQLSLSLNGNLALIDKGTGARLWQSNTGGKCILRCLAQFQRTGFLTIANLATPIPFFRIGSPLADSIEFHDRGPYVRIRKGVALVWSDAFVGTQSLASLITQPHSGPSSLYSLRDNFGRGLDGLQIEQENASQLVGVYHTLIGPDKFCLRLATSSTTALSTWVHRTDVDCDYGSQGELKRLPDGKYLMAYEKNPSAVRPFIRFRFYDSFTSLLNNQYARQFDAPMTPGANADGTPNFRWIRYNGNPDTMTVEIGFHFNRAMDGRDINGIGFLRGFQSFDSYPHSGLNEKVMQFAGWHIGDRSFFQHGGRNYTLIEAMTVRDDWNSWRLFLYDEGANQLTPLPISTPLNSPSHGNPSLQVVKIDEAFFLLGTSFVFETSEGGAHLYLRQLGYGLGAESVLQNTVGPELDLNFASTDLYHSIGRQEVDGWSVIAGEVGHMVYGPYVRTLPHAMLAANFVYMADVNTGPDVSVVTFDVFDATTGEILATRTVRRQELPPPFAWGVISLLFDMKFRVGHAIETRIWSHGSSYLKFSRVNIVD